MKKALLLWGGWEGHEPEQCIRIFEPFLRDAGYRVTVTNDSAVLADAAFMGSLALIVPCVTMGELSGKACTGLCSAVRAGAGLAGWHGGMCDAFRTSCDYQFMTGGQFVAHPGGIIDYTVNVTRRDDPLMAGIADFAMHSEQYYMHVDPSNEVLATTTFSGAHAPHIAGCVMPVVWRRPYGEGRVFYCALGHCAKDFDVPELTVIVRRGMLWASK